MKHIYTLCMLAVLGIAGIAHGQTVHAISFANTNDRDIGKSCLIDQDRFNNEVFQIASNIDYDIVTHYFIGNNCSKENLDKILSSLRCGKDDVVIFYYTGHGTRSAQDTSLFPQMCLGYTYEQDKFVPVHSVVSRLRNNGARLNIVLTDCCNSVVAGVSAKSPLASATKGASYDNQIAANYRKLFVEEKGMVVATSSKVGTTSGCNDSVGGFFSHILFGYALHGATSGKADIAPISWGSVMDYTSRLMGILTTHTPYYLVQTGGTLSTPAPSVAIPAPSSPAAHPVLAPDGELAKEMAVLLNPAYSLDYRLQQVERIAGKWFADGAIVSTIARNGKTILDYEDAPQVSSPRCSVQQYPNAMAHNMSKQEA